MIVYHGSNVIVNQPDVEHSFRSLDFGKGFCQKAIDLYYSSKLSDKIYLGKDGIQYLDYKVLAQILLETEKELLA